jgi:hypothetical protein
MTLNEPFEKSRFADVMLIVDQPVNAFTDRKTRRP